MTKFKTNKNKKVKTFTVKGAAALIIAAILAAALLFTGCNQPSGSSSGGGGGGTPPAPPNAGSFEPAGDGFVKIIPPTTGIAGVAPDYTLPEDEDYWKGVFIKDRKVKLSPYKLGKTEVTYKLWKDVYDWAVQPANGYKFVNQGREGSHGTDGADVTTNKNHPVTMVSWRDCIVWCNAYTQMKAAGYADTECVYRKSKTDATVLKDATDRTACDAAYADMSKKGFRLPTEAEWEYAARWQGSDKTNAKKYGDVWLTKLNSASGAKKPIGFSGLTLPKGETWESLRDELTRLAVYNKWWNGSDWVSQPTAVTKTAAVKSKAANAIGLYDMSGNVWEWCFDGHDYNPASNDSAYEQDGIVTDPQGAASGSCRVRRGGSWGFYAELCSVGIRSYVSPGGKDNYLGFRLAWCP